MTIREIAQEAGYGVGTVSRVLNNNPNVSEAARSKVMAVVKAHNFEPNTNARNLKRQANSGIAIIVRGIQNMLFSDLLEQIQMEIRQNGLVCMVFYLDEDADEVAEAKRVCAERRPCGIIFLGSNLDGHKKEVEKLDIPCIVMTENAASYGVRNLSSIGVDDTVSARTAIEYLLDKGHRKIGLIGGATVGSGPSRRRYDGCAIAFHQHNITFDPEKQYAYSRFSMQGGYKAANELLDKFPGMTAIFAFADITAVGAVRAILDRGYRVPDDISVIGFDGIELAHYLYPRITTIRQNVPRMARRGTEILLGCIQKHEDAVHELIPFEFQEGDSVADVSAQIRGTDPQV